MKHASFPKHIDLIRYGVALAALILAGLYGLLALMVVPAPTADTAEEVSGVIATISQPHPEMGDITIVLEGGRRYYINRANEIETLDWAQMLNEVTPGTTVYLTAVSPLAWRLFGSKQPSSHPVAGLRTAERVYMDAEVAVQTWQSQTIFSRNAGFAGLVALLCLLPDLGKIFKRQLPTAQNTI